MPTETILIIHPPRLKRNQAANQSDIMLTHFLSSHHFFDLAELQQDYLAKRELEQLIDETETSFTKINESIKTLICVVQKQEKHLLVKTGSK